MSKKPARLQLSRRKGFNLQALSKAANGREAVNVARPGAWGNPFIVGKHGTRLECVQMHLNLVNGLLCISIDRECIDAQRAHLHMVRNHLDQLRGKNVACWCLGEPCHGDTLLRVARRRVRE
jgi:hypothetical protein